MDALQSTSHTSSLLERVLGDMRARNNQGFEEDKEHKEMEGRKHIPWSLDISTLV